MFSESLSHPSPLWRAACECDLSIISVITSGLTEDFPGCSRDCNLESKVQLKRLLIIVDWIDIIVITSMKPPAGKFVLRVELCDRFQAGFSYLLYFTCMKLFTLAKDG